MQTDKFMTFMESHSKKLSFLFLFLLGLWLYKDYGISWDESTSRYNGIVSLNYVANLFGFPITDHFGNVKSLHAYFDRDYGVAFEMPSALIEYVFSIKDSQDIFFMRHLLTYIFFLFGAYSVYQLSERRFQDWKIGLFTLLIYILSPRIFAEAFYNDKDIVFMSAFAIAMNYNIKFLLESNIKNGIFAAFFVALAIDIRIMGIIIPIVTLLFLIINHIKSDDKFIKFSYILLSYILFSVIFIIIMWPWIWEDPLGNFVLAFENMAHFRWNNEVLFMGDFIKASKLPWSYIPVWIVITTPPIYLLFSLVGSIVILITILKNHIKFWNTPQEMQDYIFFGLFFAPILAVIILHSVLYDGWRQLYFVYPAFILLATVGSVYLWKLISNKSIYIRGAFMTIVTGTLINIFVNMITLHPYQNVYFNFLAGNDLKSNYELDYWGLANREALEYITENDDRDYIIVFALSATPLGHTIKIMDSNKSSKIAITGCIDKADYFLNNFRTIRDNKELEDHIEKRFKGQYKDFYSITRDNEDILKLYKKDIKIDK